MISLFNNDPVLHCEVFNYIGCAHVDGMLCDFPECSMRKEYIRKNYRDMSKEDSTNIIDKEDDGRIYKV